MTLQEIFGILLKKYIINDELIDTLWLEIKEKYSEKHRAYHNLNHLEEIFRYYDSCKDKLEQPDLICFSIFYHDVIYGVWKKDNEEKSADFALLKLSNILSTSELTSITNQIITTKTHESLNNDTQFLLDFDLAILGQSPSIYKEYLQKIRKEYKSVPNFIYKKGRKKVLQHFIDKPFIYKTPEFIDLYELQAKQNLKQELNFLKNGI